MMRFGFHISISGGFSKVVERAIKKDCETIQIFSRNPRGWKYKSFDRREVERIRKDLKMSGIFPFFVHVPYLPNLATSDPELFARSIDTLVVELQRAEVLGASFLVTHIGSRLQTVPEQDARNNVIHGINSAFDQVPNQIKLLLENTAGQGGEIGYRFSQIKEIIDAIKDKERVGVCLDTAHAFEAGYNISSREGLDNSLNEFERLIGLDKIHLLHLNDSKTPLGSRSDRHWHIGEGHIGLNGFRNIVNHPRLKKVPGIMETPQKSDDEDLKNMVTIRGLVGN